MFGQRAKTIENEIRVNEELTAEEWKRRFEKEKEKNGALRTKLAKYELGAVASAKDNSPDVIPQASVSLTCTTVSPSSTLTSHASMPCLLPHSTELLTDTCQECLQYQQDISNLYQQLDDKDDELEERSREMLGLESKLRELRQEGETLAQNNTLIMSEYNDMKRNHADSKEEIKDILSALEELARGYDDKIIEVVHRTKENEELNGQVAHLEEKVSMTASELSRVKVRLEESNKQTVDMFLEIFNDFSHVGSGGAGKLTPKRDLYKSSPNLNAMSSSYSNSIGSSISAHSGLSTLYDQDMARSTSDVMSSSLYSTSTLDLSSPTEPPSAIMSPSMYVSATPSANYQGSRQLREKVGELKGRLSTLLESNYNRIISPPDTTSSYTRNIRLRKLKARTGGRVFSVFSRANRRGAGTDDIVSRQLGRRD